MKLTDIKINPDNPQKFDDLSKLENSIKEFPKMMELRPLVVDNDNMVLGGNKRLLCLKNLGYKEIPDTWIKQAKDLTEAEQKRFIIADNIGFGEWDWDILSDWDSEELEAWGLELPMVDMINNSKEGDDIKVEQSLQILPKKEYIIIFADEGSDEWDELKSIFKCKTVRQGGCKIGSTSDKATTGLERVFNLKNFKERVGI